MASAFINTDNLTTVDVENPQSYQSLLYPNPCQSNELYLQIIGTNKMPTHYQVTDIMGKVVYENHTEHLGIGSEKLYLPENIQNGIYIIQIKDTDNDIITSERIEVLR